MKTSSKGVDLIKRFESLHDGDLHFIGLQPNMCPAGYWTEGWGRLVLDDRGNRISGIENKEKAYIFSKIKTEAQADVALLEDLRERESMVNSLRLPFNQGQFDALVSFTYNVGFARLLGSSLLKKAKINTFDPTIANEFRKWNKGTVNGKFVTMPGLVKRREAELKLYFS